MQITDESRAWDAYTTERCGNLRDQTRDAATSFNWTQYEGHGPGAEALSISAGASVLELGCGVGGNLAHIATVGARAVGVDMSARAVVIARERWGDLQGLELHHADAVQFLGRSDEMFDAMYSVFGAVWFTDPEVMLPAIRRRLGPGGVLVFSHRPPVEGWYGCQATYVTPPDGDDPLVVRRWDYTPGAWLQLLERHGFTSATAEVVSPPANTRRSGTLLVRACAPA